MIRIQQTGMYKLAETKHNTKILHLNGQAFAWVEPGIIGELLVVTHKLHKEDCILSTGHYRIYKVKDEPYLSDHLHLELEAGRNTWQGYLLLTGLPDESKTKARIIPTIERITGNQKFHIEE